MAEKKIKILSTFEIPEIGIVAELQHKEKGLPKGTILLHKESKRKFKVDKRVFDSSMMMAGSEVYFENETETTHMSLNDDHASNNSYVEAQILKRRQGIFMYLLTTAAEDSTLEKGVELLLQ